MCREKIRNNFYLELFTLVKKENKIIPYLAHNTNRINNIFNMGNPMVRVSKWTYFMHFMIEDYAQECCSCPCYLTCLHHT